MLVFHEFFVLHQRPFFLWHLNRSLRWNPWMHKMLPNRRIWALVWLHLVYIFVKLNWVVWWIQITSLIPFLRRRRPMLYLHFAHFNILFILIFPTKKANFEGIFNHAILSFILLITVSILSFINIQRQGLLPLRLHLSFRHFTITVIL